MKCAARPILLLMAFFLLPAFTTDPEAFRATVTVSQQPPDERKAQEALPKSKDALWALLGKTKITSDNKKGIYLASFPDDVKKLNGQTIKISGFMLPLESAVKFKHFLLSKRTPTCPFCPPGEPNEIIEVYTDKPVEFSETLVSVEGKFELVNQQETGIFFKLTNGHRKDL